MGNASIETKYIIRYLQKNTQKIPLLVLISTIFLTKKGDFFINKIKIKLLNN